MKNFLNKKDSTVDSTVKSKSEGVFLPSSSLTGAPSFFGETQISLTHKEIGKAEKEEKVCACQHQMGHKTLLVFVWDVL